VNINLFEFDDHVINTADFDHYLHGEVVKEFEQAICEYVGAKYAVSFFSASYALYCIMKSDVCVSSFPFVSSNGTFRSTVTIPSMIPPVVPNVIADAGLAIDFSEDVSWVGDSYKLLDNVVDSAQRLDRNQYLNECDDDDLLVFSCYPTKPLSSLDGGIVVSNNKEKIDDLKSLSFYGMEYHEDSWSRKQIQVGYKAYMSTLQATIAKRNLKNLDKKYELVDEVREKYNDAFDLNNTSRHLYRIEVGNNQLAMQHFKNRGIVCGIHYNPLHNSDVFGNGRELPSVDAAAKRTLSIPMHHKLTPTDVSYIIGTVKDYWSM
tara:strand:+ start:47 stop:1003 length:957 start_codon:yes stop_codon:yes gene_type:complete